MYEPEHNKEDLKHTEEQEAAAAAAAERQARAASSKLRVSKRALFRYKN